MIGEEKKTKARTVRLCESTDRQIVALARQEQRHPAEVARRLIEEALAAKTCSIKGA